VPASQKIILSAFNPSSGVYAGAERWLYKFRMYKFRNSPTVVAPGLTVQSVCAGTVSSSGSCGSTGGAKAGRCSMPSASRRAWAGVLPFSR
jgi:hypothetical protein